MPRPLRLAAPLLICLLALPAAADAARTRVVHVTPLAADGSLKPGYEPVQLSSDGECSGSAYEGVWRCQTTGPGIEPCWPGTDPTQSEFVDFTCMFEPWSKEVYLFEQSSARPPAGGNRKLVWGVRLAGGSRCRLSTGGGTSMAFGKRVSYACGAFELIGNPNRKRRTWRIEAVRYDPEKGRYGGYRRAGVKRIKTAWLPAA
jgi:hypothetical protein